MEHQIFKTIIHVLPDAAVIELFGEINSTAEKGLLDACDTAVNSEKHVIAIDFSHVSYINSTGIALIVQLLAKARQAQRRVVGFGLSSHYMEIFKITRLSDFIDLSQDQASVLQTNDYHEPGMS
jgi:anti-anti-sigma factor